jgi:hypothetical protein
MKKLTTATKEAKEAEQKLAEDKLSQHYKDQEAAITKLAAMHLITEEQKDDRLKLLEQQQANAAIKILDDELKAEEKLRDAAQAKLNAAKTNPASTAAELTELQAELEKEVAAVAKAEDEKLKAQEKFNQQSEANEKSHYERAYLEAVAFGRQLLSEAMRENHAALIAKEQELDQAKARHENTDAVKEEIAALKQKEQALEKAATGDTKAAAALLKYDQAQLATAKNTLADAKARGVDTTAIEQHIKSLETDTVALDKALNGDKKLLAAQIQVTQAHLLAAQAILQLAKAQGLDTTVIDQNIVALQKQLQALQQQVVEFPKVKFGMEGLKKSLQELTGGLDQFEQQTAKTFATAIMGAIESGKSIGAALEQATKQILEQLATQALSEALYNTAKGIAAAASGDEVAAAGFFAAAEMFAAVAAVSGAAGIAMPGAGGGSNGKTEQGPTPGQTTTSQGGGSGPNQVVGTTKLAAGGIVSQPTMITPDVMAGDSPSGGGAAEEAILPLSDPTAMRRIAQAISPFAPPSPTPRETAGFTSGEPSPGEKSAFTTSQPTESEKSQFLASQPSVSPKPGFETSTNSPTVGEALGFKFDTPYPGDKPVFSSGQPSASSKPGFSSGVQSPHEEEEWNFGQPSPGLRPGFDFSAPSLPREMPDMESLAANFGGLLSAPTLRAASNAQVPMAAVAGSPSATPMDLEARMERFAEKLGAQMQPESTSSDAGDTTHIHVNVKGLMDSGNLKKIMKKQNRMVQNRQATLKASDSLRVTRRSQ